MVTCYNEATAFRDYVVMSYDNRNLKHEDEAEVVGQRFQKHWEKEMRKEK